MADRSTKVTVGADVSPYVAGMQKVKASTRDVTRDIAKSSQDNRAAWDQVGKAVTGYGLVVAAGLGAAVVTSAKFQKEISGVGAVSNASAKQMDQLGAAALAAGADVNLAGVSAAGAAKAEAELAKAGIEVADILGGALTGALSLAVAGQLDQAEAATIAAEALNVWNMAGSQTGHVADVLAAAANKSAADVASLGQGIAQAGLVAEASGLSFEETTGTLAAFADNALKGSDAGTSLKTMLQRLTPQSEEAKGLMDELGFSAFDASGNFIGMAGVAEELQDALAGMTQEQRNSALATLFGSDAVRGANVLYKVGAEGIRGYVAAVDDAGAATRMAAAMTDNLAGDFEALQGAIETALIQSGGDADGVLRTLTQSAAEAVNVFNELPEPLRRAGVILAALSGGVALFGGGLMLVIPRIVATRAAMIELTAASGAAGTVTRGAVGFLGPAALAATAVTVLGSEWLSMAEAARSAGAASAEALNEMGGDSVARVREELQKLADDTGGGLFSRLTNSSAENFARGLSEQLEKAASPELRASILEQAEAMGLLSSKVNELTGETQYYTQAVLGDLAPNLVTTSGQLKDLNHEMFIASQASYDMGLANRVASADVEVGAASLRRHTEAAQSSVEWTEASAAAAAEQVAAMSGVTASLLSSADPMVRYSEGLAGINAASREHAAATAESTESSKDSWEDYFTEVDASYSAYRDSLEQQARDQEEWYDNLNTIRMRAGDDYADMLAEQGPEFASLHAEIANQEGDVIREGAAAHAALRDRALQEQVDAVVRGGTDIVDETGRYAAEAVGALAEELGVAPSKVEEALEESNVVAGRKLDRLADIAGEKTAETVGRIVTELGLGATEIERIVDGYASAIHDGVMPVLMQLRGSGGAVVLRQDLGQSTPGMQYADGGVHLPSIGDQQPQIQPNRGPRGITWAETGAGPWEGFVSGHPSKVERSRKVTQDIAGRLGGVAVFADGGMMLEGVPDPPSFGKYGSPLVDPAVAGVNALSAMATEFMRRNALAGQASTGFGGVRPHVARSGNLINKLFGPMTIGGVGQRANKSDHPLGLALDFMTYSDVGKGNRISDFLLKNLAEHKVKYLIWRQRINSGSGWRGMASRGNPTADHMDHPHVSYRAMADGGILNPWNRDRGGPLRPGYTLNATGANETVLPDRALRAVVAELEAVNEELAKIALAADRRDVAERRAGLKGDDLAEFDRERAERRALDALRDRQRALEDELALTEKLTAEANRWREIAADPSSIAEAILFGAREAGAGLGFGVQGRYKAPGGGAMSLERQTNRAQHLFDAAPLDEQRRSLRLLLADTESYSDLWVTITSQLERVNGQIADRRDQLRRETVQAREEQSRLRAQIADLRGQQADARREYREAVAEAQRLHAQRRAERISGRTDELAGSGGGGVTSGFVIGADGAVSDQSYGKGLAQLYAREARELDAARGALQQLRSAGLSESVIRDRGLDSGIGALGDLRALVGDLSQISGINSAFGARRGSASATTNYEVAGGYGQVSQDLSGFRADMNTAISQAAAQQQATLDRLAEQIRTVKQDQRDALKGSTITIQTEHGGFSGTVKSVMDRAEQAEVARYAARSA